MLRLFVALPCPPQWSAAIRSVQAGVEGARWQSAEQLHLTLAFLGEVDEPVARDIDAALDRVTHPPFSIALHGTGAFDRRGRAHSLWAGVTPQADVSLLASKVEEAARRAGLLLQTRRYVPHVTLARLAVPVATVEPWLAATAAFAAPPHHFDQFHLYSSDLGSGGARYHLLGRYDLG